MKQNGLERGWCCGLRFVRVIWNGEGKKCRKWNRTGNTNGEDQTSSAIPCNATEGIHHQIILFYYFGLVIILWGLSDWMGDEKGNKKRSVRISCGTISQLIFRRYPLIFFLFIIVTINTRPSVDNPYKYNPSSFAYLHFPQPISLSSILPSLQSSIQSWSLLLTLSQSPQFLPSRSQMASRTLAQRMSVSWAWRCTSLVVCVFTSPRFHLASSKHSNPLRNIVHLRGGPRSLRWRCQG